MANKILLTKKNAPYGAFFVWLIYKFISYPENYSKLSASVIFRITLPQTYLRTSELAGTLRVTTLPDPITLPAPIVTPGFTTTLLASQQLSSIVIGAPYS